MTAPDSASNYKSALNWWEVNLKRSHRQSTSSWHCASLCHLQEDVASRLIFFGKIFDEFCRFYRIHLGKIEWHIFKHQ